MLSPEIMQGLSQLNRQMPLPAANAPRPHRRQNADANQAASDRLLGAEYATPWGACWCIERNLFEAAPVVRREMHAILQENSFCSVTTDTHVDLRILASSVPHDTMFLDLETCGFAGSMIFLAGLVRATEDGPMLMQLMARNYAEEKALLQALWQVASHHRVLVTFNGKTFDWPAVHDRSTIHHLGRDERHLVNPERRVAEYPVTAALERTHRRPDLQHVDLLHHCRRKWKNTLPNCRLQTLERYLCGRRRVDDIPGHAIPAAYHQYVRGENRWAMRSILHHNALDLVTLVQLALRVCVAEDCAAGASAGTDMSDVS